MDDEIRAIRQVLNELTKDDKANICEGNILKLSQKLDELIVIYYLNNDSEDES